MAKPLARIPYDRDWRLVLERLEAKECELEVQDCCGELFDGKPKRWQFPLQAAVN